MFSPFEKVVITRNFDRQNAKVIGIRQQANNRVSYLLELVRKDFASYRTRAKIIRISSDDIANRRVIIEKHHH